jgi:hypothetical protein
MIRPDRFRELGMEVTFGMLGQFTRDGAGVVRTATSKTSSLES